MTLYKEIKFPKSSFFFSSGMQRPKMQDETEIIRFSEADPEKRPCLNVQMKMFLMERILVARVVAV